MKILRFVALATGILFLSACSVTVNVPTLTPGTTRTLVIHEPPESGAEISTINIKMGAGSLKLSGGSDQLIEGTIDYNIEAWKPVLKREGSTVTLSQQAESTFSLPDGELKNNWDLKLGNMPLELSLASGAYEGELHLGGLALRKLTISDGASASKLFFDSPNGMAMEELTYHTGASTIEMIGLGNARVQQFEFNSGMGNYVLDFTGENTNDCNGEIKSGMSSITIRIPANARAEIIIEDELSDINLTGTWTVENNTYHSGEAGALIRLRVNMAMGNLELIHE